MNWPLAGELLLTAYAYVQRGWCQKGPARNARGGFVLFPELDEDNEAVAWSVIGALMRACRDHGVSWQRANEVQRDKEGNITSASPIFLALDCVREAAGLSNRRPMLHAIGDWQDSLEDSPVHGTAREQFMRIMSRAVEPFRAQRLFTAAGGR